MSYLSLLDTHEEISWQLVGASVAACFVLQKLVQLLTWSYAQTLNMSYKDGWEWINRLVSTIHCTSMGLISCFWLWLLATKTDPASLSVHGSMPYAGVASSLSIGYFIWDSIYALYMDADVAREWRSREAAAKAAAEAKGQPAPTPSRRPAKMGDMMLLLHHAVGSIGQFTSINSAGLPLFYVGLLACECTTPFLNLLWIRRKMRINSGAFHKVIEVLFVVLWIPFRLVIPGYCLYYMCVNFPLLWQTAPMPPFAMSVWSIPFLNYLNWVWFIKIVRIVSGNAGKDDKSD